ncbi:MAG: TonB family protein [Cyanobacteria bacterium P01_D01_bin.105]
MSLSSTCLEQHEKENAITRKWLLRGLAVTAGAHIGLIPLMALIPKGEVEPPARIALVVTGPVDPVETSIKDIPTEESIEELAEAELAVSAQILGGTSAPPPISAFPPSPLLDSGVSPNSAEALEPVEDDQVSETEMETELESEAQPSELSSLEIAESETTQDAPNDSQAGKPDLDALRARLARAQQGAENTRSTGSEDVPAVPNGMGTETARRTAPPSESGSESEAGTGTGETSRNGSGDRDSSSSTTVSCRRCDRPDYPEEALEDGIEGAPAVSLKYDQNGRVIDAELEQSSGNAALDAAALEAAHNYELDSAGRSGSVTVEIDFGIEGSARSQAARQRGERNSVTTPAPAAPEREIGQELEAASTPPPAEPGTTVSTRTPIPSELEISTFEATESVETQALEPTPEENVPSVPEPVAPVPDISLEPAPLSEPASLPLEPQSPSEPAPPSVPDIMSPN